MHANPRHRMTPRINPILDRRYLPELVLIAVVLVWGSSFIVVKEAVQSAPPLAFLFFRFLLAAVILFPILLTHRTGKRLWQDGIVLGFLLALGMGSQVIGQTETSASKAAFITGLCVPLTPLVGIFRTRRPPSLENFLGIVFATIGFFLLTFPTAEGPLNRGDIMIFWCALAFAFYIVELSVRSPRHNPAALTAIQVGMVALLAGISSLAFHLLPISTKATELEMRPLSWNRVLLLEILYLGSLGTVGTFFGQSWAQKFMSATHAAVLFGLEPVFAALLAAWLLKERLGTPGTLGALLVMAGVVVSELRLFKSNRGSIQDG